MARKKTRPARRPRRPSRKEPTGGPRAGRPEMVADYRIATGPKGLLPWDRAVRRLRRAHNYWVVTTRPDGRPHAMPVWGVWLDQTLYFGTDGRSRKARNVAVNPAMVVHLESGDDVVILEGRAEEVKDRDRLARIDEAYAAKYDIHLIGHPGQVAVFGLGPRVAFGWLEREFNKSATRWRF